ncbi:MAG: hypothetical protein HY013_17085 [Candidatus Solibacter usitatus]|nr:hypothetical protein [Candidatus Solibacter usitatus]
MAAPKAPAAAPDPRAISVHPFTGRRGDTFVATVRGIGLRETTSVFLDRAPLAVTVEGTQPEPPNENAARSKVPFDLVRLRIQAAADARPGRYPFRLVTARGVSNALTIHITDYPVAAEPEGSHETPATAVAVERQPVVFTGRISRRGESDYYVFDAMAGQTLTFEAISGLPAIGAAGSNAPGFDPSLAIYEPSGSWFDPKRVNRIAFNDEPLWTFGQPSDAYLVHKFEKTGRYFLRLEAFSGQGGPDYGYQLKILPGEAPQDTAPPREGWDEHDFPRHLSANRLNDLAERGGRPRDQKSIETYGASLFKFPGTIEGGIARPGEAHRARFHLDGPRDIAIEVETPATAPPLFNPVVRMLNAAGEEVATNVFAGRGACSGALNKSIQAKTIVPVRDPGDYTVEIRDTTSDLAEPGFRYRVQVRPQIPHVGKVRIDEDHVNLAPGGVKTVRVMFDREEDYRGAVVVAVESLPPGVQALAGADFEADKDAPLTASKRERYTARSERIVVVLTASPDAAVTKEPRLARMVVRPVVDGNPGAVVATKDIPVMVVGTP